MMMQDDVDDDDVGLASPYVAGPGVANILVDDDAGRC